MYALNVNECYPSVSLNKKNKQTPNENDPNDLIILMT